MTVYPLDELLTLWGQERLTSEQVIGQMLQHLHLLQDRIRALEAPTPATPADQDLTPSNPVSEKSPPPAPVRPIKRIRRPKR